ncbi:hypothetical protein JCM6882_000642 [Rhodosporidiobolus microsporus]
MPSVIDNNLDLAYAPALGLGAGAHSLSGKAAGASPFRSTSLSLPAATDIPRHSNFTVTLLRLRDQLARTLQSNLVSRLPILGSPLPAAASLLRHVKLSDLEMVTLIDTTWDSLPQVLRMQDLVLDEEANILLSQDPRQFAERYGDYFVAGYSSRAHFTAVATHRATNKEDLDKFAAQVLACFEKSSLEPADSDKLGETNSMTSLIRKIGTAFTGFGDQTRDLQVETTLVVDCAGIQGPPLPAGNFDQLASYLTNVVQVSPVPLVAHLRPLKSIDARCLSPEVSALPELTEKLLSASSQVFALQNVVLSNTFPELDTHLSTLYQLSDELSTLKSASQEAIDSWFTRFDAEKVEINKKLVRRDFMKDVLSTFDVSKWQFTESHKFVSRAAGFESHRAGLCPYILDQVLNARQQFIRDEIVMQQEELRYDDRLIPSHPVIRLPNNSGFVIGFEITNDRDDGHSGEAYLKQANRDGVVVEFRPDSLRDSYWTVRVWTLDRALYRSD